MHKKKGKAGRLMKLTGIAVVSLVVLLYVLYPIGFGAFASIRVSKPSGEAPEGFADVELKASDGVTLKGWYAPGENWAAILVLHGSNGNRDAARPYAQFLHDNGFGVLAIDLRGHGSSGGRANAFGWRCTEDVRAAVQFLKNQPGVKAIGALGLSMGGETLLGAAGDCPEIGAITSDGASHRCTADYVALPANQGLLHSWTTSVMYWSVGLFTGDPQPKPLVGSIASAKGTAFLLIAAGDVHKEIDLNTLYRSVSGDSAELWVVPGVGHTGAFSKYRGEYTDRVIQFFKKTLDIRKETQ